LMSPMLMNMLSDGGTVSMGRVAPARRGKYQ
jgi:hypothetical protein